MDNFIDQTKCKNELVCQTCRKRTEGRPYRSLLSSKYIIPHIDPGSNNRYDFECPKGKLWDKPIGSDEVGETKEPCCDKPILL